MTRKKLVALHGNLGTVDDWKFLSDSDLLAVDLWDHSEKPFPEMAAYLASLAVDEKPVLLGYSMGGRIALDTLVRYPDQWSGGVILSAHPGLPGVEDRIARRVSDQVWAQLARKLKWSDFLQMWDRQPVLQGVGHAEGRQTLASRTGEIARAFENWSLGCQEDLRHLIAKCHLPILWVTGGKDEKFSAIGQEMAQLNSNIDHRTIPGCGHRVHFENPEVVANLIDDFQDRLID